MFYRERGVGFLSKIRGDRSRDKMHRRWDATQAGACFSETWVFLSCESTLLLGRYFVPRFEDKEEERGRRRRRRRERKREKKSSDSCKNEPLAILPRRAEKKEFATSCRHRFPVSLRPRRGRQSNLGVESERRWTCEGLRPRAGPSAKKCCSYREGTVFPLNGEGFSWPPCIGTSCDIYMKRRAARTQAKRQNTEHAPEHPRVYDRGFWIQFNPRPQQG